MGTVIPAMAVSNALIYQVDILVHSAGEVFLGQFATRLVIGSFVELDTLQIS